MGSTAVCSKRWPAPRYMKSCNMDFIWPVNVSGKLVRLATFAQNKAMMPKDPRSWGIRETGSVPAEKKEGPRPMTF
jgi:hypothetical protein